MTQQEKHLLLKDLCGRLPYGVKITDGLHIATLKVRIDTAPATLAQFMHSDGLKYYLRPMSSMMDSERLIYEQRLHGIGSSIVTIDLDDVMPHIDWLNAHHFDYRGLIPMGLALEAPEGMYSIQ